MEQHVRIELTSQRWKRRIIPLYQYCLHAPSPYTIEFQFEQYQTRRLKMIFWISQSITKRSATLDYRFRLLTVYQVLFTYLTTLIDGIRTHTFRRLDRLNYHVLHITFIVCFNKFDGTRRN